MTDEVQTSEVMPETVDAVVESVSPSDTSVVSDDDAYGAVYDKLVSQNGADRAEDGKFKSTRDEPVDGAEDQGSPGGEEGAVEDAEAAGVPPATDATDAPAAPSHLPQDVKAAWDKMPVEARKAFADYTAQQDRKFGELGRAAQKAQAVEQVVNEFKEYFDGSKGKHDPAQAMRSLFNIQRSMDTDPVGTLYKIAQTYGIHDQLFQGSADSAREISALTQQIAQLQSHISKIADEGFIDTRVSQTLEARDVTKAIDEFAKANPYYAEVEDSLPAFIDVAKSRLGATAAPVEVLKAAYDMAVNAIPEVRAKVEAAKQNEAASQPDPKRSDAAKKAASINVKSKGTGKQSFSSEEEAMSAVWDKYNAA